MGEKKLRQSRRSRLIAEQPWCIYCGGSERADTVDHMPPIIAFDQRQRPKGLEFSACDACNRGTSGADQVAAYLSRMYPDARSKDAVRDLRKLLQAIKSNYPGLLEEMLPTEEQVETHNQNIGILPANSHPLNVGRPRVLALLNAFAAKLGLALHFEGTKRIVPAEGRVAVRVFSNVEALTGGVPPSLLNLFPSGKTLRQGKMNVADQFRYASVFTTEGTMSAHLAVFRQSFAIAAFAADAESQLSSSPEGNLFLPFKGGPIRA